MTGVLGRAFTIDSLGQDNFGRLARYESSKDRAFYRAARELQLLQKARISFARPDEQQPETPKSQSITTEPPAAPPKRYSLQPNGKLIQLPSALPLTAHAATIVK